MALIRQFEAIGASYSGRFHGEVDCGYAIFENRGEAVSPARYIWVEHTSNPGKVSQSIQINEEGARSLKRLLQQAFPGV